MVDLIVRPLAEADIVSAHAWYVEQREPLGAEFLSELARTIERIEANPRQFLDVGEGVRRALMRGFPYAMYFVEHGGAGSIVAVLHLHRRESIWRDRVRN